MKVLVVSDGTSDSGAALAYGIAKARETSGQLIALLVHQRHFTNDDAGRHNSKRPMHDHLRFCESAQASIHGHTCRVPVSVDFFIMNDCSDILRYASIAQFDLIVSPPAFEAMFSKACCLVDIVSAEDEQMVNS